MNDEKITVRVTDTGQTMDVVVFAEYALQGLSMTTPPELMVSLDGPEVASSRPTTSGPRATLPIGRRRSRSTTTASPTSTSPSSRPRSPFVP